MLYNGQHNFKEGGKGGGGHVSQRGKKQFRNSRVLLKKQLVHLHNSLFTDLYHVPLVRAGYFYSICSRRYFSL